MRTYQSWDSAEVEILLKCYDECKRTGVKNLVKTACVLFQQRTANQRGFKSITAKLSNLILAANAVSSNRGGGTVRQMLKMLVARKIAESSEASPTQRRHHPVGGMAQLPSRKNLPPSWLEEKRLKRKTRPSDMTQVQQPSGIDSIEIVHQHHCTASFRCDQIVGSVYKEGNLKLVVCGRRVAIDTSHQYCRHHLEFQRKLQKRIGILLFARENS